MQASGKTSLVNVIGSGQVASLLYFRSEPDSFDGERQWTEDTVPTVAFNYRKVRKGAVTLKIWDVAGQPKFRSMWERYCNGVDAVMCVLFPIACLIRPISGIQPPLVLCYGKEDSPLVKIRRRFCRRAYPGATQVRVITG